MNQLEKMGDFFNKRLDGYEVHQLNCIDNAKEFYSLVSKYLPKQKNANILDLGCGTGLELNEYFKLNPFAKVTGIDLAQDMLHELKLKFPKQDLTLLNQSYFDVDFGVNQFDACISCESLHHFTIEEKQPLYSRIHECLKERGQFILLDYIIVDEQEEKMHFDELHKLKLEQHILKGVFYHYDTPLTQDHEISIIKNAGFSSIKIVNRWANTLLIVATK